MHIMRNTGQNNSVKWRLFMNEKIFKTIRGTGAASLAVGIVVLVTGISAGVMMIVNGARLLGTFAVFCNLAGNVIGFIPFGMILPVIWPKTGKVLRILLLSFEFSLCVETIQLVWKVGSFDVDDLILNTLGGVIGYLLFWICNKIRRKIYG